MNHLKPALVLLFLLTLITGVAYPLLVTGIAQVVFAGPANGSLIRGSRGSVVGSKLIGQAFDDPKYFWSRPSATSPAFNGGSSSGSNLGPLNPALVDVVTARIAALKTADPGNTSPVPVDLVTASASGLDPHISPAAASYQVMRVGRARGIEATVVLELVNRCTEGRQFGLLGEPRVNVLRLNLTLDGEAP